MKPLRNHARQKGYILALNIAVLALMFVAVSYMGQRMALATSLAYAEKQRVDTDYQLESAKAEIMLMLATVPRSRKGLGQGDRHVALDGRYYRMDHSTIVSLQDIRGMIALNGVTLNGVGRQRIERLLGTYGIDQLSSSSLTDALLDYRDADDLKRLNGAEKEDYKLTGKEGQIRNDDLLGVNELARVLGWSENQVLWSDDPITRHVSVEKRSSFNPNTADWRALVAMSTIQEELAKNLVASRRAGEIEDISPLIYGGALGDPFGPNAAVSLFPGATVIVTLRKEGLNWGYRLVIAHTPEYNISPWRIESVERLALPALDQPIDKLPRMPKISELRDLSVALRVQSPF